MNISEVFSFFILFTTVLSIFFGIYLYEKLVFKHRTDIALKWFLVFVLIHTLFIIFSRYLLLDDLFHGEAAPFGLLYMPFYWQLICLTESKSIRFKQIVPHFIPAVLFWVLFFILLSTDKLPVLYYTSFKNALYGVSAVLLMSYGVFGYFTLNRSVDKIEDVGFKKLIVVFSLIMIIASILLFSDLFRNDDHNNIITMNVSFFVYLLKLSLVLSTDRMWLYRCFYEIDSENNEEDQSDKYSKSRMEDAALEESIKELEALGILVYLDVDLNLEKLAKYLKISKYELSQVFSIGLETSFAKYVNNKRCEYACELLLRRKITNETIEDIAFQSGFNSNTTFYRAFKENYGVPPSRYS